jgi:hypothetical protein
MVLPFAFIACTDSDDENTIVGTWKNTGALPKEVNVTGNEELKMRIGDHLIKMSGDGSTITFYENGQVAFSNGETATYSINGKTLTFSYAGGHTVSSEYSIDGRMLTIHEDVTGEYTNAYPNDVINKVVVAKLYGK